MAKGKRKGISKTKKKKQNYMIYIVAAIMLFSGFFWMTRTETQGNTQLNPSENLSNTVQYTVAPVGNGTALIQITTPLDEIIAIPLKPEFVRFEGVQAVLNSSIEGVSEVSAELTNAYILFKFRADNVSTVKDNVSSLVRSELGDTRVYRAYDGLMSGGSIYVIADFGLDSSSFVRAILLERQDTFQTIGIETKKIAVGPVVSADVGYVGSVYVEGIVEDSVNESVLGEEFGGYNLHVTPRGDGNATLFSLSFAVSNESAIVNASTRLAALGIQNVTVFREGFISIPDEILIDGEILKPLRANNSYAKLSADTKKNDRINVSIIVEKEEGNISSVEIRETSLK